jgi:hypothetical protein
MITGQGGCAGAPPGTLGCGSSSGGNHGSSGGGGGSCPDWEPGCPGFTGGGAGPGGESEYGPGYNQALLDEPTYSPSYGQVPAYHPVYPVQQNETAASLTNETGNPLFREDCIGRMIQLGACPSEAGLAGTTPQQVKQSLIGSGIVILSALLGPAADAFSSVFGGAAEEAGSLSIEGEGFSASEKAVAENLASQGRNVVLREATGVGRTSDLLVDGTPYDVYTPEAGTSVRNILSNVASKWTQVNGGGVVVDLGSTDLTASDFGGNALARVNGFVNSWGGTPLSDLMFYEGG